MLGLIGKKLGQTRVYDAKGTAVPVTVVHAGPNIVVQKKTVDSDGYAAVQLGFGPQKDHRISKPLAGHLAKAKAPSLRKLLEFRDFPLNVNPGDKVSVTVFAEGDYVDAIGVTKGRGFEGVVKRHGFRGGDITHGAKGWHRRSGAIGQRLFPGTVMRGMRMPGHMGQVRRTTQNLQVVKVLEEDQLLLIKGAIPGANGDYVVIRAAKKRKKAEAKK
ncbi:MAG: 50S ribosomal protein L3 [Candidatus Hydrogenedentes bacterium]|nr:50S ribosomal protein L3 [Candidatus Hydrogenedentota bacterium]